MLDDGDDDGVNNNNKPSSTSKDKAENKKRDDSDNTCSEQSVEKHKSEQGDDAEEVSNKNSNVDEQDDDNDEDDGDRKPAARQRNDDDDDDDDDSSSSSSSIADDESSRNDSDNDKDDESNDGRELSDYEKLRLERIRRNREYLSQLGLEGSMPKKQAPPSRKKRKEQQQQQQQHPTAPQRSSSRSRKTVNYTEPSVSVAQLLRDSKKLLPAAKSASSAPSSANGVATITAKPKKESKPRAPRGTNTKLMHRMERFIYNEFNSIKAHKKRTLKDAERNTRLAEKEVSYWTKRASIWERQQERQRAAAAAKQAAEQERADLGGTVRELMQDIDRRMPELLAAVSEYDEVFEVSIYLFITDCLCCCCRFTKTLLPVSEKSNTVLRLTVRHHSLLLLYGFVPGWNQSSRKRSQTTRE